MGFVYTVQLTVTAEGYFGKKFHKVAIRYYYLEAIRMLGLLQDFFVVTTEQKTILFLFSIRFSVTTTQIVCLV